MIKFRSPKTMVKQAPMSSAADPGKLLITGRATSPQLSPTTTVWNKKRFASIMEEVARWQRSHTGKSTSVDWYKGLMISTNRYAKEVMIRKHKHEDQKRSFRRLQHCTSLRWVCYVRGRAGCFPQRGFQLHRKTVVFRNGDGRPGLL